MSTADRRAMLERDHPILSIRGQCAMLGISRSGVYRPRAANDDDDLALMRRIDALFMARPFLGSRRMAAWLATPQAPVNRKRVQRLMRLIGLVAVYQRPNTSKPAAAHKVYPYLLGGLSIDRVNQVWCSDITYIPMAKGFVYLVAIMDWHSRAVLAWRLSNTLDARISASRRSRRRWRALVGRRSSTPTRAASSPATTSPAACEPARITMDGGALHGQRLHRAAMAQPQIRGRLPEGLRRRPRGAPVSPRGSAFTTADVLIKRWPAERRWRCGARPSPAPWPATPWT